MAKKKLFTLGDVMPTGSSRTRRAARYNYAQDQALLDRCRAAWENKRHVRENRERVMNYVYGDQWGEIIRYRGGQMTERQYMINRGNVPLTNNVMIGIQNTLVGLYTKQQTEPVCFARVRNMQKLSDMMSATMQANWQDTKMPDIMKVVFEDSLDGGVACVRETYEERNQVFDSWTDFINPNYLFWEGGGDPRHSDVNLIGVLHDITREDLYFKFARSEYGLTTDILDEMFVYRDMPDYTSGLQQNEQNELAFISFETPSDLRKVRVIEVWHEETRKRYQCYDPIGRSGDDMRFRVEMKDIGHVKEENAQRKALYDTAGVPEEQRAYIYYEVINDKFWQYTYMTSDGTVICEGESPYEFHDHPFTLKLYPFVNGEVHPFMGNIIDQQRYINRLIVMHDMAVRSSAKGLMMVPRNVIPDDMSPEDFAEEVTEYDGIIFYDISRENPNAKPEILTTNSVQIGTYELLQLQLNLTKEISNVSGAIQGREPTSGTSASRYAMETQNSTTSLYSILHDMTSFVESVARKKCSIIKQYYDEGRVILNNNNEAIEYDKAGARDVSFKIAIKESAASAAFQSTINDTLKELLMGGHINVMHYLQNANLPFADNLLKQLMDEQKMQQQAAAQQAAMSPEQQQKADDNVAQANKILKS